MTRDSEDLTVSQLIPIADRLARDAGMTVSPSKLSTLARRYVRAVKDGAKVPPFGDYLLNAVMSVPPMQIVRGRNAYGFTDEPGATVAHHLDQMMPFDSEDRIGPSYADIRRAAVRAMREERRHG